MGGRGTDEPRGGREGKRRVFDIEFLRRIRIAEIDSVVADLPAGGRVLEFGAGDGTQAMDLSRRGFDVIGIDLARSAHAGHRVFPVLDYDGSQIPLPDSSVDVVFSSNVLEHVEDLPGALAEMRRVTRDGGLGVHLVPSVAWRAWTLVTGPPTSLAAVGFMLASLASGRPTAVSDALRSGRVAITAALPIAHGASGNAFSELFRYRSSRWRRDFESHGFEVLRSRRSSLFHTGHMLLGPRLSMARRADLATRLGSAAEVFVVRPVRTSRIE